MFVATHKQIVGTEKIQLTLVKDQGVTDEVFDAGIEIIECYYFFESGLPHKMRKKQFDMVYKPITLPCPHCSSLCVDCEGKGFTFDYPNADCIHGVDDSTPCDSCGCSGKQLLQQQERVCCEKCGMILKAIDEEMLEFLECYCCGDFEDLWHKNGNDKIGFKAHFITICYPECTNGENVNIYKINSIHWLEIKAGK